MDSEFALNVVPFTRNVELPHCIRRRTGAPVILSSTVQPSPPASAPHVTELPYPTLDLAGFLLPVLRFSQAIRSVKEAGTSILMLAGGCTTTMQTRTRSLGRFAHHPKSAT